MRKILFAAALSLAACASLTACDPPASAGQVAVTADAKLTQAESAYAAAKEFAELFIPLLPADKVALIQRSEAIVDTALVTARGALTIAEREAALKKANAAIGQINAATPATPAVD